MTLLIKNNVSENEWNSYLTHCPNATVYHTPEWKKFLEKTFSYKPYYIFAINENGETSGLLPLFEVNNLCYGNRLVSVPFAHECNPLGDPHIVGELVSAGIQLGKKNKNTFVEFRSNVKNSELLTKNLFSTYILPLSTVEKTWNLIHKSAKRYICKSMKSVTITTSNFEEDADTLYQLNCINKKNKGVPSHPKFFFKNMSAILKDSVHIYIAKLGRDPIGGILTVDSGAHTTIYGYGATNPKYSRYSPVYACLWKSIEDSSQSRRKWFDFGRVSYDNTNLIEFKKKWGTFERKIYYSYYPLYVSSLNSSRDNMTYHIATKIIRFMPMPVYKTFSNHIFSHFG